MTTPQPEQKKRSYAKLILILVLGILYLSTMAQTLVLGDPTEYTFIANILGIAHPPGYAFTTVMGKLFQTLIPFGSYPWRMHLMSATAAIASALFIFGMIRVLGKNLSGFTNLTGLFGAMVATTAVNHWQHAIHANPHIMTATFLVANLFFLTKYYSTSKQKWLFAFCFSAGLGVTHHPLTVFGFPGYAIFILVVRPKILRDWRTLLKMVGFALLGLSLWLYFPLRSPHVAFGPTTMNTLNGFLDHVLARGLSNSLPYYTFADVPQRLIVFWSILRLQYSLPTIFLATFGLFWLAKKHKASAGSAPLIILYILPFLGITAFVMSLRAQDIMAYILGPMLVVGLLAGIGLLGMLTLIHARLNIDWRLMQGITAVSLLFGFGWHIYHNAPLVSLRNYSEGVDYITAVTARFENTNQGATLLNDWERMTPLWYTELVNKSLPNPDDVRLEFISTGSANPWLDGVFANLPSGPIYLSNFRPDAFAGTEFRLRPDEPFYEVLEPGDATIPENLTPLTATAGAIEVVGFGLVETAVSGGDFVPLTLAMRAPQGTVDFYAPVLHVGNMRFEFTTDSHLTTPTWWVGEVIVERFDFALPHDLPSGSYPLTLDMKNLSRDELIPLNLSLGELTVTAQPHPIETDGLLANFRQRVGLVGATVRGNGRSLRAPASADNPLIVEQGDTLNILLKWKSLARAEESYTIFVHLIDAGNVPHISLDYTPLGGSMPSHLWIPKWLPGQQLLDPYRMEIPDTLPSGTYFIEVGIYEMIGHRRLHISDQDGNLAGDRYILGTIIVE